MVTIFLCGVLAAGGVFFVQPAHDRVTSTSSVVTPTVISAQVVKTTHDDTDDFDFDKRNKQIFFCRAHNGIPVVTFVREQM